MSIAPSLLPLAEPVASLVLMSGNPRRGDVEAVARSLASFGQRKPVVARRADRVVIAGNHTLQAARQLGWVDLAVVWVDDDDTTAKAYSLADNRTATLGGYDDAELATLITAVRDEENLFAATGYSEFDLVELLGRIEKANAKANPEPPETFPEYTDGIPTANTCPKCGYEW